MHVQNSENRCCYFCLGLLDVGDLQPPMALAFNISNSIFTF